MCPGDCISCEVGLIMDCVCALRLVEVEYDLVPFGEIELLPLPLSCLFVASSRSSILTLNISRLVFLVHRPQLPLVLACLDQDRALLYQ